MTGSSWFLLSCFRIFCYTRTCEGTYCRLSFMSGEKYLNINISTFFRVWERWSVTELNIRIAWIIGWNDPCGRLFEVQPPLPPGFPEPFIPPHPARISILRGCVDFFWNNPLQQQQQHLQYNLSTCTSEVSYNQGKGIIVFSFSSSVKCYVWGFGWSKNNRKPFECWLYKSWILMLMFLKYDDKINLWS